MTRLEIADRLEKLAAAMLEIGVEMDYFGGLTDAEIAEHGRELCGAARIAQDWAFCIREAAQ